MAKRARPAANAAADRAKATACVSRAVSGQLSAGIFRLLMNDSTQLPAPPDGAVRPARRPVAGHAAVRAALAFVGGHPPPAVARLVEEDVAFGAGVVHHRVGLREHE